MQKYATVAWRKGGRAAWVVRGDAFVMAS